MTSLSEGKQSEVTEAVRSTSRYLDNLLNVDNNYFDSLINQIDPLELQFNTAKSSETEALFFGVAFVYFRRACFMQNVW